MLDAIVSQRDFLSLVAELAATRRIVGPIAREDRYFYEELPAVDALDLNFNYCVYSPKRFLLPPTETLFRFHNERGGFEATPSFDDRPLALVGVHPCDVHALRLLDKVFEQDHADPHYLTRRTHTLIVGVDCPKPCTDGTYCVDMKTNAATEGFDVMLYPLGDAPQDGRRYGVAFGTPAGRDWLVNTRRCSLASAADEQAFEQYQRAKAAAFPRTLKMTGDELPGMLDRSYDSLLWEATARRCYSCGSCNLVCPTCYCFNMRDELDMTLQGGERIREWDGCQLRDFALVAGNHNFRARPAQRLRHRIYRKAKWIRERTSLTGCVGCARCDRACTAKIHTVDIYNQLAEEM
jgi:sulfhydrogenase subunit beta (sulfur reductase)